MGVGGIRGGSCRGFLREAGATRVCDDAPPALPPNVVGVTGQSVFRRNARGLAPSRLGSVMWLLLCRGIFKRVK